MTILSARAVARSYGLKPVLTSANFALEAGERVGFVGRNGAGKSTLARILAGIEEPDSGEVVRRSGLRVATLSQDPVFEPGVTAVDAVLGGLGDWAEAMKNYEAVSTRLETIDPEDPGLNQLLEDQAEAANQVEDRGGWEKRHEALAMLDHLGIPDGEAVCDTMSGGERRRVALASTLVAAPDLAILDEPTNHLDLATVEWLERWLIERFRGALILVTHDRFLLDRCVNRTIEIADGEAHSYAGGWSRYLEAKAEREAHAGRVESNRQNFLRRELEWLRRSPKARSTKQKARVDRAESARDVVVTRDRGDARIEMTHTRAGRTILEARKLAVDVAGRRLVESFDLNLSTGDRVGIIGPNGCGKTSLLRVLTGEVEPAEGSIALGKNTKIALLDQTRAGLDDAESVFDNVAEGRGQIEVGGQAMTVGQYLERFLFRSSDQRQLVGTLSGGERARVALARTLRHGANVVVLDEPTNDLDVDTLSALESALLDYRGSLLVVTHDRWFLDRVANSLLVFDGTSVVRHEGGYSDWVERRDTSSSATTESPAAKPGKPAKPAKPGKKRDSSRATAQRSGRSKKAAKPERAPLTHAERIELNALESKIEDAEERVRDLEETVSNPSFYLASTEEQGVAFAQLKAAQVESEALTERWAALEERAG